MHCISSIINQRSITQACVNCQIIFVLEPSGNKELLQNQKPPIVEEEGLEISQGTLLSIRHTEPTYSGAGCLLSASTLSHAHHTCLLAPSVCTQPCSEVAYNPHAAHPGIPLRATHHTTTHTGALTMPNQSENQPSQR